MAARRRHGDASRRRQCLSRRLRAGAGRALPPRCRHGRRPCRRGCAAGARGGLHRAHPAPGRGRSRGGAGGHGRSFRAWCGRALMNRSADPPALATPFPDPPAPGEAVEIAEGAPWLRLPLPMALDHVNVYAFRDDDGWSVVDTGIDSARTRALWQRLLSGPLSGAPVARVLLTHHHPDHVGLAGWLATEHGAEVISTRTAWLFARMLTLDEQTRQKASVSGTGRGWPGKTSPAGPASGPSTSPMSSPRSPSASRASTRGRGFAWVGATGGCASARAMRPTTRCCCPKTANS